MGQTRIPPIHPNCRCTLIPYIELRDSKGNIIDIDAERPAANADFDELAKNAYNENARQKGLKRRWDDLSSATKLKYYYQAQKDYERDNPGKKAYEQVSGSLTFAQYFKNQSEEFKRSWLGVKRYQLYVDGSLDENKIFAPDLGYTVSTPTLFKVSKSEAVIEENLENLIREQKESLETDSYKTDSHGFPENIEDITEKNRAGGSTGAMFAVAPNGDKFIKKVGKSTSNEHLQSECNADAFYRACGINVPEFKLFDVEGTSIKLSKQLDNVESLNSWWNKASQSEKDKMRAQLRQGFAVDILLGNWDVVGMSGDNILIQKLPNGENKAWRIDNGGALSFRAQGKRKTSDAWNDGFIDDLWSMTGNGNRIGNSTSTTITQYFGSTDVLELAQEITAQPLAGRIANALNVLPQAERAVVKKRLKEIKEIADRGTGFVDNGYTRDFTLSILDETYKYSKDGLRELCAFTCDLENGDYGWFRSKKSASSSNSTSLKGIDSEIQDKIEKALKTINHHNGQGGDQKPNQSSITNALDLKPKLQDALNQGLPNAQYYLDILDAIEDANANQKTLPHYDVKKPVFSAQNNQNNNNNQFNSLSEYLRDRIGNDAVNYIEDCCKSQSNDSYNANVYSNGYNSACAMKFLRLRAQGFDIRDYSSFQEMYDDIVITKQYGYYLGDPRKTGKPKDHYDSLVYTFNRLKNNLKEYDIYYERMVKYNAGLQIALENADFSGNDKNTKTIVLMRTEDKSVISINGTTPKIGDKCKHNVGVNESHSVIKTVAVKGHELTMVRVPYSRINGLYMMESHRGSMYLGDGENEFSADTHGLDIYYVDDGVYSGFSVKSYVKKFNNMENNIHNNKLFKF